MRQLTVALLVGVILLAAVLVLAVAPALTDRATGGDANRSGDGWENASFFGFP